MEQDPPNAVTSEDDRGGDGGDSVGKVKSNKSSNQEEEEEGEEGEREDSAYGSGDFDEQSKAGASESEVRVCVCVYVRCTERTIGHRTHVGTVNCKVLACRLSLPGGALHEQ